MEKKGSSKTQVKAKVPKKTKAKQKPSKLKTGKTRKNLKKTTKGEAKKKTKVKPKVKADVKKKAKLEKSEPEEGAEEKEEVEIVDEELEEEEEEEEEVYVVKQKPELPKQIKVKLRLRSEAKKKKPKFKRQEWFRYKRLGDSWRRPRGLHSKMRTNRKYRINRVRVGYKTTADVRGLHSSGFKEKLVYNKSDLKTLNPKLEAARIGHSVGTRKRIEIEEYADELGIRILNRGA